MRQKTFSVRRRARDTASIRSNAFFDSSDDCFRVYFGETASAMRAGRKIKLMVTRTARNVLSDHLMRDLLPEGAINFFIHGAED